MQPLSARSVFAPPKILQPPVQGASAPRSLDFGGYWLIDDVK
jgi:hypothetical protein